MKLIKEAITGWFGERCQEAMEGCPCCDAWAEYDALTRLAEAADRMAEAIGVECNEGRTHGAEFRRRYQNLRAALAAAKAVRHG